MPTFSNLKDLEKFVQGRVEKSIKGKGVTSLFQHAMQDKVYTEVYDYYQPLQYVRRGDDDGLSDPRNMSFTEHTKEGKTLVSLFENLTVGSDTPVYDYSTDSMDGYFISNLIENGSSNIHTTESNSTNGWYELGKWSDPRPFAKATAEALNNPSSHLNKTLKFILETEINK